MFKFDFVSDEIVDNEPDKPSVEKRVPEVELKIHSLEELVSKQVLMMHRCINYEQLGLKAP